MRQGRHDTTEALEEELLRLRQQQPLLQAMQNSERRLLEAVCVFVLPFVL